MPYMSSVSCGSVERSKIAGRLGLHLEGEVVGGQPRGELVVVRRHVGLVQRFEGCRASCAGVATVVPFGMSRFSTGLSPGRNMVGW